jgi:hypothetical protein
VGKHFREQSQTEGVDSARRLFLKRSLAGATGLIGWRLFDATEGKGNQRYGSSAYGGK